MIKNLIDGTAGMVNKNLWYWKQNGKVLGPFPAGQIQEYIILKRVHPNDLMSQDKETWQKVSKIPSLIPDVIKDKKSENYEERLAAAKRWIDDRESDRTETIDSLVTEIPNVNKRQAITHIVINVLGWKSVAALLLVTALVIAAFFYLTPEKEVVEINCSAKAMSNTIFDRCNKRGFNFSNKILDGASFNNANLVGASFSQSSLKQAKMRYAKMNNAILSYGNFTGADLTGADLTSARLLQTDFSQADLSYANLEKAKAKNIILNNTKLDKAIWFNGQICASGSTGKCLVQKN